MPLNQSGILNGRRIYAQDVSDLYDLLTGVMTDQPVTLMDGLTVVGTFTATSSVFESSSATAVALIAQGTLGQTADIFQVKSYSGGTYFRVDAGGTLWYGTATVTTNPMTAAADLITGGVAGAPTRLGKGAALQVLRTNAGTTALEWASPALTVSQAALASNTTFVNANTFYDGPTITVVGPGTFLAMSSVNMQGGGGGNLTSKMWDGTTVIASSFSQVPSGAEYCQQAMMGTYVLASGTVTLKTSGAFTLGSSAGRMLAAAASNGAGNNASIITAVKIG